MKRPEDPHAWIREIWPEEYARLICEGFAFLTREFGFSEPEVEPCPVVSMRIAYRARKIAIEVMGEIKDPIIEVALVWLRDGVRPDGWKIDAGGQIFKVGLFEALVARGIHQRASGMPEEASPQERLRFWTRKWEQELRTSFADVLAGSDQFFVKLNEGRAIKHAKAVEKEYFAVGERLFKMQDYRAVLAHFTGCNYQLSALWVSRLNFARSRA